MTAALMIMSNVAMRYKDFEFPSNPSTISVSVSKSTDKSSMYSKGASVEELFINPTVITGSGVFYGENARESCIYLTRLLKTKNAAWLFCPDCNPVYAYLTEFSYTIDSKKCCASYSFKFVESESDTGVERLLDYSVAEENDNAFTIANRENVSVSDIMRLNDFCTPFDISQGERVRIR